MIKLDAALRLKTRHMASFGWIATSEVYAQDESNPDSYITIGFVFKKPTVDGGVNPEWHYQALGGTQWSPDRVSPIGTYRNRRDAVEALRDHVCVLMRDAHARRTAKNTP